MFEKPIEAVDALAHFCHLHGAAIFDADDATFLRDDGEVLEVGWCDTMLYVAEQVFSPSEGYAHVKAWIQGEAAQEACQVETEPEKMDPETGLPCSLERCLYVMYCAVHNKGIDSRH